MIKKNAEIRQDVYRMSRFTVVETGKREAFPHSACTENGNGWTKSIKPTMRVASSTVSTFSAVSFSSILKRKKCLRLLLWHYDREFRLDCILREGISSSVCWNSFHCTQSSSIFNILIQITNALQSLMLRITVTIAEPLRSPSWISLVNVIRKILSILLTLQRPR